MTAQLMNGRRYNIELTQRVEHIIVTNLEVAPGVIVNYWSMTVPEAKAFRDQLTNAINATELYANAKT